MSRHAHRARWIGRIDVPGHWCRTCWTFAPTVRAMQTHADVFEPGVTPPATDDQEDET